MASGISMAGLLLTGPPGTGKTLLARSVAASCGARVTVINGPELLSGEYGASETRLRALFLAAVHAAPALIFIDEIDAMCPAVCICFWAGRVRTRRCWCVCVVSW